MLGEQWKKKKKTKATKVYEQCHRSVVRIDIGPPHNGFGSGAVWDNNPHLIVTCDHVIRDAATISVTVYNGKPCIAEVVVSDKGKDLAVLRVEVPKDQHLTPTTARNSATLDVGEKVFIIASPFGFLNSISSGMISQLNREVSYPSGEGEAPRYQIKDAIQIDPPINRGSSGAPVFDSSGKLIGIVACLYSDKESVPSTYTGVAFAIPVNYVTELVNEAVRSGRYTRNWLPSYSRQLHTNILNSANGACTMVVTAGSKSPKFNLRRGIDSVQLLVSDNSNGDISRTNRGCFSSMAEVDGDPSLVSCTTFNILAPIYKRIDPPDQGLRESNFRLHWLSRNHRILDCLIHESSSIICLQEFWVGNDELVRMYEERLGSAGYHLFKLARTNFHGDGLLTAINKEYLRVLNHRELLFDDFDGHVAQLLHVQSVATYKQNQKGSLPQEFLIVNTHLLFPRDSSLFIMGLRQVNKLLQYVELYQRENRLRPMPIILCGEWNGSKRGHVYKFLRSQGFVSSYDIAHQYTDNDAEAHKWVSQRNHRGNICGVDFIWLRNPIKARKALKKSWDEAVFSLIKYQLRKASLSEDDAFAFMKGDNCDDFLTYSSFSEALRQMKLIGGPYGLCFQEVKDLWAQADIDGNGVLDFEEFKQKIWNSTCSDHMLEGLEGSMEDANAEHEQEAIGFEVKNAILFPREVEKGMWPEDYSLSDHARLTVVFSPARVFCSGSQRSHS